MRRPFFRSAFIAALLVSFWGAPLHVVRAADPATPPVEEGSSDNLCAGPAGCAATPGECGSKEQTTEAYKAYQKKQTERDDCNLVAASGAEQNPECESLLKEKKPPEKTYVTPINCLFLEEPIGGSNLYKVSCGSFVGKAASGCYYQKYSNEALDPARQERVVQAILSFEEGKPYQGPFGLLYNYVGLIYKYLSGLIIFFVILMIIVGGIQIITSAGDRAKAEEAQGRIVGALAGLVIWFLASLILYTINPTFFVYQ